MNKSLIALLALVTVAAAQLPAGSSTWAVLVAGSNTWANYRHQSDVYHAYQICRSHGIPDSNIIVMHFDDIATNIENPTPGTIINNYKGPNVYANVPKDYTGMDVNSKNFLNILLGNEAAMAGIGSGRVLKSTSNDYVFINFVDHGAVGLVAFPYDELYASDLESTLQQMYNNKQYKQLTFYMEACEAGSMFLTLPTNINIYVTTASNAVQSSYACYYDPIYGTYLGDLYSVNWMENSDASNLATLTLAQQFQTVVAKTDLSNPQEYGDTSINALPVGYFQGLGTSTSSRVAKRRPVPVALPKDAVPSSEVAMEILKHKLNDAATSEDKEKFQAEIDSLVSMRNQLGEKVKAIVKLSIANVGAAEKIMNERHELKPELSGCHKEVVSYFSKNCYTLGQNAYAMQYVQTFANLCHINVSPDVMKAAMDKVCEANIQGVN